ncbi:MAG: hypothetical protein QOH25_2223 [Acidobacteriota bacterium]|jgi:hypothetical protein|nr:hypothetical protein [Acidobacteriota bacterium]
MRQRLAIIVTIAVVLVLLVVLNTASYVTEERLPDTEFNPDRSTYNAGATGTRALYDLLVESGRQVMRWREQPYSLLNSTGSSSPSTFVIIGKTRVPLKEDEAKTILKWVERGGRLVIIDRRPDPRLLPRSHNWIISTEAQELPRSMVNPNKPEEMTAGVARVSASQPSALTRSVESVQPSRYAGTINISENSPTPVAQEGSSPPSVIVEDDEEATDENDEQPPSSSPEDTTAPPEDSVYVNQTLTSPAPVSHLENYRGPLLVDYPHGMGRIIVLSDPYIVANGGIRLADNLQLALNVTAGGGGFIAFDEYHQERAAAGNHFLAYFAGTPIVWMLAQGALLLLIWLWTRGRRFARPLPVPFVDRRSSLEFVASMAELQQRARAYDLAIENIYTRLRRVLVRYGGLSHNSPRAEIAARVAARSSGKLDPVKLESLMHECEDAIQGAPVDGRKSLELVTRLRDVERALGLRMRSRETRQAAEGL